MGFLPSGSELFVLLIIIIAVIAWRRRRSSHTSYEPELDTLDVEEVPLDLDETISQAIDHRQRLFLRYADINGTITERRIAPYSWDGRILGAYCFSYQAPRNFRADRIIEVYRG